MQAFSRLTMVLLLSFLFSACSQRKAGIDRMEVERILSTLAADDMEGRGIFKPGLDRAATFLAKEFGRAGLEKLDGADGYLQRFEYYSLSPQHTEITVAGESVGSDEFFVTGSHEAVLWATGDDVRIHLLGPDGNIRATFTELRGSDEKNLILIDRVHTEDFQRYRGFFGKGTRTKTLNDGGLNLFILTDHTSSEIFQVIIHQAVETLHLANVVGKISGVRSNEFVLFSAHYDHLGIIDPVEGDSIANGANDDASGTTAVVALARFFADSPPPERTLLFSLFTAEESGGFGSQYFSSQLDPDEIVAMFNIEMIGKPAVEGPNTAWITGFDRSSFGQILQAAVEGSPYTFYPDPYPGQNLFFRSDNATLARLGVPAHSISTAPIDVDPDYHKVTDEVSTLDIDHMTDTIKAIAAAAVTIVSGEATPTRITLE